MLVDDKPLAVLIFQNRSPSEVTHFNFAGLGGHLFFHSRGGPKDDLRARLMAASSFSVNFALL